MASKDAVEMKRQKRLTKRERKQQNPGPRPPQQNQHIHCIACGRHINGGEFSASPATATQIICEHGGRFAACAGCTIEAERRVAEHDRTGKAVQAAAAWH